ncbi:MAG: DUF1801 domain-containing protein [Pseudomonadota bacterium]
MGKSNNKTVATRASVTDFVRSVDDPEKRRDLKTVMAMMRRATGKRATMWGPTIVGFGRYDYRYETGREGSAPLTGVSPRKQALTVYIMPGFAKYGALLKTLGKHKTSKSCLYIKRLSDVNEAVLERLIERSVRDMKAKYKVA